MIRLLVYPSVLDQRCRLRAVLLEGILGTAAEGTQAAGSLAVDHPEDSSPAGDVPLEDVPVVGILEEHSLGARTPAEETPAAGQTDLVDTVQTGTAVVVADSHRPVSDNQHSRKISSSLLLETKITPFSKMLSDGMFTDLRVQFNKGDQKTEISGRMFEYFFYRDHIESNGLLKPPLLFIYWRYFLCLMVRLSPTSLSSCP